jgi:hypothetical protein
MPSKLTITATLATPLVTGGGYFTLDALLAGILFDKMQDVDAAHAAVPVTCVDSLFHASAAIIESQAVAQNEEHRHSGIRYVTPAQRHRGEAPELLQHRVAVYEAARKRQPQRWSGKIRNWTLPDAVWLNPEREVGSGQKRQAA